MQIAAEFIVIAIRSNGKSAFCYRYNVYTLAAFERDMPIILRYACDDIVVRNLPLLTDIAILNPQVSIVFGNSNSCFRILDEHCRMWLS